MPMGSGRTVNEWPVCVPSMLLDEMRVGVERTSALVGVDIEEKNLWIQSDVKN